MSTFTFFVLIQLFFGLRSSFYLFIVHHFFRFGQSFHSDMTVFFYLLFKFSSLLSKEYAAPSSYIISNIYYRAINFFIPVINNNSGQGLSHNIYLILPRIIAIFFSCFVNWNVTSSRHTLWLTHIFTFP